MTRRHFLEAGAATVLASGASAAESFVPAPPHLRVTADGRHFLRGDGHPFFWLADTAWELFHRLSLPEAEIYLEDRRRKGFSVIQAVALAELDGLRIPNANGDLPLVDLDPARLNEPYFAHVDQVIAIAAAKGLVIALLPTWGDKFNLKWGVGPEIFTPANARTFGALLARRYRQSPIVWVLGGDRNPETPAHFAIVRAMAEGIRSEVGPTQLITYHPQGQSRSWDFFHDEPWIDFHMFQSGHAQRGFENFEFTTAGRALNPPKPVLDGEPRYEDIPIDLKAGNGWFDAADVRQAGWWSVLAGAAGHSYGNHNIWQMWAPGRAPIIFARTPWRKALDHPGAAQMGLLRGLLEQVGFSRLQPANHVLAETRSGGARQLAAIHDETGLLLAYTPHGKDIVIAEANRSPAAWFQWFDPRTGQLRPPTPVADNSGRFVADGVKGRGMDWVLLIHPAGRAGSTRMDPMHPLQAGPRSEWKVRNKPAPIVPLEF